MAENKKSFLLYCDVIHTVAKLTDEQAGDVFKHILAYVNDLNPTPNSVITEIVFEPIKQQLKRDLTRWEGERSKRSEAGKKGMAERWKKDNNDMPTITGDNNVIDPITLVTDNVTVTVNVTDNVIIEKYKTVLMSAIEKAEKAALLSTRKGLLMQYCDDTSCYNLVEMTNEMFLEVLAFHKQKYDEKMEVCRLAEIERERMAKGREEEQKRIAEENRALKATLAIEKEKTDKLQAELKERDIVAAKPIPQPVVVYGARTEHEVFKYDTLEKIVKQLESCNYECEAGYLCNNVAFIALKRMAESEVE
jgi:hypothetical protein